MKSLMWLKVLVISLLFTDILYAQNVNGTISAQSTDCSVANSCVILNPSNNSGSIRFTVQGTHNDTLVFEFYDGSVWASLTVFDLVNASLGTSRIQTTTTVIGSYVTPNFNYPQVRIRSSSHSSGSANIVITGTQPNPITSLAFGGGSGGTIGTVNQGTASVSENWRVNCVSGCTGGTSDVDDGTIASGQTTGLSLSLSQVFDGTNWKRFTIGTAGTASAQVVTVQGIASGTNLNTAVNAPLPAGSNAIGTVTAVGAAASGASKSGNPVQTGGVFNTTQPTVTTGQMVEWQSTARGAQIVATGVEIPHFICDSGCSGSGGTSLADNGVFTSGTTLATPASGFYESSPTTITSGRAGALGMTTNRELKVALSSGGTPVTLSTDATTNTTTQTSGPQIFANASAATPTAVGADGRSIAFWTDTVGRLNTNVNTLGGQVPAYNSGTNGATVIRVNEATDSQLSAGVGATGDAAATVGSTGSLAAKMRLMTTQLDAIQTAVQLIDDDQTGATPYYLTSAASTNSTSVKGTAGRIMNYHLINTTATLSYLRMYNASSAPTCSSATNFVKTIPIPASTTGDGIVISLAPTGEAFTTGIGFCLTGGGGSTDNTNTVTGVYINIDYK